MDVEGIVVEYEGCEECDESRGAFHARAFQGARVRSKHDFEVARMFCIVKVNP
jgi:hypothetical protein